MSSYHHQPRRQQKSASAALDAPVYSPGTARHHKTIAEGIALSALEGFEESPMKTPHKVGSLEHYQSELSFVLAACGTRCPLTIDLLQKEIARCKELQLRAKEVQIHPTEGRLITFLPNDEEEEEQRQQQQQVVSSEQELIAEDQQQSVGSMSMPMHMQMHMHMPMPMQMQMQMYPPMHYEHCSIEESMQMMPMPVPMMMAPPMVPMPQPQQQHPAESMLQQKSQPVVLQARENSMALSSNNHLARKSSKEAKVESEGNKENASSQPSYSTSQSVAPTSTTTTTTTASTASTNHSTTLLRGVTTFKNREYRHKMFVPVCDFPKYVSQLSTVPCFVPIRDRSSILFVH
jgi:hypothetical protein